MFGHSTVSETRTTVLPGRRIGPYRIAGLLGEGGMGAVYRAVDTRLDRSVAIKISDQRYTARLEQEVRTIAALNHPHICTLYDVGSLPDGTAYMVTELIEGETLREWLRQPRPAERSIEIARQVLEALRAAHQAGIVHRDLKPANIMVRFDGYAKVLDFGLAKHTSGAVPRQSGISASGQIVGTVAYMSPEQILGQELDGRSDLFAFGIILYEMLAGRHPWPRESSVDTMHAILHDEPVPFEGPLSGVVERLLRRNREERYESAEAVLESMACPEPARSAPTRLMVLPFRILRADASSDFLSVSLPDAITTSLAEIDSLVVRSTMTAAHLAASETQDLRSLGEQAQVDAIVTGTILSSGDRLRVNTQLVRVTDGRLLWSNASDASLNDVFQLQDELVNRIVQSLALPLTDRERRALNRDVPANAAGYEFYLRANQLINTGYNLRNMTLARDLYIQSVDADPQYAPAWACLGRAYRYVGKFVAGERHNLQLAENAFQKAFQLNSELALAHNFYTGLEADSGRSLQAMERLLRRAQTHQHDPHLLTGLVQACRYCGLLEASVAAHERARQLDPYVRTSVAYTYFHLGQFQRALDHCPAPTDAILIAPSLDALGRQKEALTLLRENEPHMAEGVRVSAAAYEAYFEGRYDDGAEALEGPPAFDDPEAHFFYGCLMAKLQRPERALEYLSLALDQGYRCRHALLNDRWLESLRSRSEFLDLLARAAALDVEARQAFADSGGERLLGITLGDAVAVAAS